METVVVCGHAVAFQHLLARHFRGVVGGKGQLGAVVGGGNGFGRGLLVAGLIDEAQCQHPAEYPVASFQAGFGPADRVVARRCLGNARQHRLLGKVQFADGLAVVHLRCCLKAVGAMAQEHAVEVELEDFLLLQRPLDLYGQQDLVELAHEGPFQRQEVVACHLHGEGAAAGALFPGQHQFRHGAHQAHEVNAPMTEKIIVLRGQQGVHELLRDGVKGQGRPFLLAELADQVSFPRVDPHRRLQANVTQGFHVGQVGAQIQVDTCQQPKPSEGTQQADAQKKCQESQVIPLQNSGLYYLEQGRGDAFGNYMLFFAFDCINACVIP